MPQQQQIPTPPQLQPGYYNEPQPLSNKSAPVSRGRWHRLCRYFVARSLRKNAKRWHCTAPLKLRRRAARYDVRLERIMRGRPPFQHEKRPPRDRMPYWTIEDAGYTGRPRTRWEAWKRAWHASCWISTFEYSDLYGYPFRGGIVPKPEQLRRYHFRIDFQKRNGKRLRRIFAGLNPWREPHGASRVRYIRLRRHCHSDSDHDGYW